MDFPTQILDACDLAFGDGFHRFGCALDSFQDTLFFVLFLGGHNDQGHNVLQNSVGQAEHWCARSARGMVSGEFFYF